MELILTCKRCGYRWTRRAKGRLPKQCSRCKSFNWNQDEVRGRGRPPKPVAEDPLTITADTIAEFKSEETAPVMSHDMPMVEHGATCSCTSCLYERGAL